MISKKILRIYLFIFIWAIFALNVGQTFAKKNSPFLIILFIGIVLMLLILGRHIRDFVIDKSIFLYAIFVLYTFFSTTWASERQYAISGFWVVAFTLLILFVFYTISTESNVNIYTLCAYICIAAFFTYFYLILKYGLNVTWNIRNDSFAGLTLYNANNVGKIYCLGAICGFEKFKNANQNKYIYLIVSILLIILMLFCGSKTNLFFMITFFILAFCLKYNKRKNNLFIILIIPFLLYGVYLALIYIPVLYNVVGHRFLELFNFFEGNVEKYSSTWYRMEMYRNGWNAFLKKPIFGYGMSNAFLYNSFEWTFKSGVYLHSNYMELLVDLGIIGTFLYYLIYFYSLKWNLIKYKKGDETSVVFISLIIAFLISDISSVSYLSRPSIIIIIITCLYGKGRLRKNI